MDWVECVVAVLAVLIACTILSRAFQYYRRLYLTLPVWDTSKGHHWVHLEESQHPGALYCNACTTSVTEGVECDFCGVVVHHDRACMAQADGQLSCRQLSSFGEWGAKDDPDKAGAAGGPLKHLWVAGNISTDPIMSDSDDYYPARYVCAVCEDLCGGGPGLCDRRCAWCQVVLHDQCEAYYTKICDLGKLKTMIIPPNVLQLKLVGIKGRRHWSVSQCSVPNIPNWKPVIVLSNKLSGNGEGDLVLRAFRKVLNPVQVVDLSQVPPEFALEWCRLVPRCTVLIAAGDGTIGWVLETVEKLQLEKLPEFAVLPLGTGNDLSRTLGWGSGHSGPVDAHSVLSQMAEASLVQMDRWAVKIEPSKGSLLRRFNRFNAWRVRNLKMTNYLSIGVDALVTLNFHTRRAKLPRVMSGRLMNKFLFFTYGTKDVLERSCQKLNRKITLFLDGKFVDLPEIEGIVILNIPFWGAGVKPWLMGSSWVMESPMTKIGRLTQGGSWTALPPTSNAQSSSMASVDAHQLQSSGLSSENGLNDRPAKGPPGVLNLGVDQDLTDRDLSSIQNSSVSFKLGGQRILSRATASSRDHRVSVNSTEEISDYVPQIGEVESLNNSDKSRNFDSCVSEPFLPSNHSKNSTNLSTLSVKRASSQSPTTSSRSISAPRTVLEFAPPSYNDGMLEVFALYSSFHIAQMQVGLSEPCRLGQASEVRIVVKSSAPSLGGTGGALPMQIDGEPWLQGPSVISVTKSGAVEMLAAREATSPSSPSSPGYQTF